MTFTMTCPGDQQEAGKPMPVKVRSLTTRVTLRYGYKGPLVCAILIIGWSIAICVFIGYE